MKKKIDLVALIKFFIQLAFFIFLPALFSVAFNGIKYITEQINKSDVLIWNPFLSILVVLILFTVVFGRFFCGFACAFGSIGDWLFAASSYVQRKIRKRVFKLSAKAIYVLQYLKYLVLVCIIIASITGIYTYIAPADPWEVFALFRAGNFSINGKIISAIVLLFILIGMLLIERFFCMFLCPLGAIFSLLPIIPFTTYNKKAEDCIPGCKLCSKNCPAGLSLGDKNSKYGDCFQCGMCSVKCPKDNMRLGFRKLKGTEPWLQLGKAAILFAICYPLMNG